MWQVLFTVINVSVLQYITAHVLINKTDVQVAYHVTNGNHCESGDHMFQIILQQTLPDCVIECALREHCAVMNYRAEMNLCELHLKKETTVERNSNRCISVHKNDMRLIKTPCNGNRVCTNGTACDRNRNRKECLYKECKQLPVLDDGHILGNRRSNGSRIRYKCNQGYKLFEKWKKTAVCNNGQWSCSGRYVLGVQVGENCAGLTCLDDNARCIKKTAHESYCHCNFGFEFDEHLNTCVKVCNLYSHDPNDFVKLTNKKVDDYRMGNNTGVTELEECVNFCYETHPTFLSFHFNSKTCSCRRVSEQQFIKAHGELKDTNAKSFYNRPCVTPA